MSADEVEKLVMIARIDDHASVSAIPHVYRAITLGDCGCLWISQGVLAGDEKAECIRPRAKRFDIASSRQRLSCLRIHSVRANDHVSMEGLASFKGDSGLVGIDITNFAGNVQDGGDAFASRRQSSGFQAGVKMTTMNQQPFLHHMVSKRD